MKVCIVSLRSLAHHVVLDAPPRGGAETQSTVLADALARRGHDVSVIVSDYDAGARRKPRRTPYPLINAYDTQAGLPGLRFLVPRWSGMWQALARADAEVYFQMCAGLATGQVALFCRRARRGFVFATASDSDVDPTRIRLSRRDRCFYRHGLRHADRVVTQHAGQQAALRGKCGIDSIPIGMLTDLPETLSGPEEPAAVLWVGTLRAVKRPEIWLEMARRLPEVRFVMIGGAAPTEPSLLPRIREMAAEIPNVEFRGLVDDPRPALERAWLLLNTSEIEGFPNTFLEAWARRVPTVSFFDPAGLVAQHGLGLIAADAAGMEAALRELLGSRARRDELGANGRAYVEREHAPEAVARRFESVFAEAIAAARRR